MSNEVALLDSGNTEAMLATMGFDPNESAGSTNTLPRLRIWHDAMMGEAEVKGKKKKVEVVEAGTFRLEYDKDDDGAPIYAYAKEIVVRPFLQRFMYKRFVPAKGDRSSQYIKTQMHDNLDVDLKDTSGGFNCGKTAGYIKDFKALPEKQQDLIKQIKRVRAVFGTVELIEPIDGEGNPIEDFEESPFIWEIDNRDAFKTVGVPFTTLAKKRQLPLNHRIQFTLEEHELNNGGCYYLPVSALKLNTDPEISDEDKELFTDLIEWVKHYNTYVVSEFDKKHVTQNTPEEQSSVKDFVDTDDVIDVDSVEVEDEEEAAA